MQPAIDKSLQHQLDHPHKGKDELLQWVRENRHAVLDGLEYVGAGQGTGKQIRPKKKKRGKGTIRPLHAPSVY